jgi:hypothetical protein
MPRPRSTFNERRRYKKLALDFPFNEEKDWWEDCLTRCKKITPVFNSNGHYMDRKTQTFWIEVNGEAWEYGNKKRWEYELNTVGVPPLSVEVREAIVALKRNRLASEQQLKLLYYDNCMRMTRSVYIESKISASKMLLKIRRSQRKKVR